MTLVSVTRGPGFRHQAEGRPCRPRCHGAPGSPVPSEPHPQPPPPGHTKALHGRSGGPERGTHYGHTRSAHGRAPGQGVVGSRAVSGPAGISPCASTCPKPPARRADPRPWTASGPARACFPDAQFSFLSLKRRTRLWHMGWVTHPMPSPAPAALAPASPRSSPFSSPNKHPSKLPANHVGAETWRTHSRAAPARSRPPEQLGLGTILRHRDLPRVFEGDVAIVSYTARLPGDTGWRPCPRGGGPSCKLHVWSFPKNVNRREPRTCPDLLKLSIPVLPLISLMNCFLFPPFLGRIFRIPTGSSVS